MTPVQAILKRRAPYRTSQGRRIRTLFHAFMAKLNPDDPLHVAQALRAAELATAAEEARGKLLQAGTWRGDAAVKQRLGFYASTRRRV